MTYFISIYFWKSSAIKTSTLVQNNILLCAAVGYVMLNMLDNYIVFFFVSLERNNSFLIYN